MVIKRGGNVGPLWATLRNDARNPERELIHRETIEERLKKDEEESEQGVQVSGGLPMGLKKDVYLDPEFYDDQGRFRISPLKKK